MGTVHWSKTQFVLILRCSWKEFNEQWMHCLLKGGYIVSSALSGHTKSNAVGRSFFASVNRHSRTWTPPMWRAIHMCVWHANESRCVSYNANRNRNRTHYVKSNVTLASWQLAELIRSRIVVCFDTLLNTFWRMLALGRLRSQVFSFCCCNCALSFYFHALGSLIPSLSLSYVVRTLSALQTCSIPENLFGLRACCFSLSLSLSLSHTAPLGR